ncbi:MAG: hypothetical protein Q8L65_05390 [Burkholderiales bacterium]|nr:hypothetical protein [Burkholderiales bacterium]MDP2398622.1 hypothetical protein [Burkholderiales bacterium]
MSEQPGRRHPGVRQPDRENQPPVSDPKPDEKPVKDPPRNPEQPRKPVKEPPARQR